MRPSSGYNEGILSYLQELVTRSNSRTLFMGNRNKAKALFVQCEADLNLKFVHALYNLSVTRLFKTLHIKHTFVYNFRALIYKSD